MNESAPNIEKGVLDSEKGSDGVWRTEKDQVSNKVEELIRGVAGFDDMSFDDKIGALKTLLSDIEDKNDHLMIESFARKIKDHKKAREYASNMENSGKRAGSSIDQKT